MKIDDVADDLIISEKKYGCYLLYTAKEYYLYKPENDSFTAVRIDIAETPDEVEDAIINLDLSTESGNIVWIYSRYCWFIKWRKT